MTSQPLYDPPRVGGDILAWCTKCKMELAHVVISMITGRAARVICKTCKSEHNFKRIGDTTASKKRSSTTGTKKAAAARTTVRASEYWEQKMAEKKTAPTIPYAATQTYTQGDVIDHKSFGVGIVEDAKLGNGKKMTVMFREGERLLVHSISAPADKGDG